LAHTGFLNNVSEKAIAAETDAFLSYFISKIIIGTNGNALSGNFICIESGLANENAGLNGLVQEVRG
jgi:hypothetical protein